MVGLGLTAGRWFLGGGWRWVLIAAALAWGGCCAAAAALLVVVVAVGLAVERGNVARAPSTAPFYDTPLVCVRGANGSSGFETLANRSLAAQLGALPLAHCGPCGACSTEQDLAAYARTRLTLTASTTQCALKVLTGGRDSVAACMDSSVGLSPACTRCWVDNVVCDQHSCQCQACP